MKYALSRYTRRIDPLHPDEGFEMVPDIPVGSSFVSVNLRPSIIKDQSRGRIDTSGRCLIRVPGAVILPANAIEFGADPDEIIPNSVLALLGNDLGITLVGPSRRLGDVVFEIVDGHGRNNDGGRWNRVKPTNGFSSGGGKVRGQKYREVFLGELMKREEEGPFDPVLHNTIIVDDTFAALGSGSNLDGWTPDTTNTPGNDWDGNTGFKGDGGGNVSFDGSGKWINVDCGTGLEDGKSFALYNAGGSNQDLRLHGRATTAAAGTPSNQGYEGDFSVKNDRLRIRESGVGTIATQTGYTMANNVDHTFALELSGSGIDMGHDTGDTDTPTMGRLTTTDMTITTGTHWGAQGQNQLNTAMDWKDFRVDNLAAEGGTTVAVSAGVLNLSGDVSVDLSLATQAANLIITGQTNSIDEALTIAKSTLPLSRPLSVDQNLLTQEAVLNIVGADIAIAQGLTAPVSAGAVTLDGQILTVAQAGTIAKGLIALGRPVSINQTNLIAAGDVSIVGKAITLFQSQVLAFTKGVLNIIGQALSIDQVVLVAKGFIRVRGRTVNFIIDGIQAAYRMAWGKGVSPKKGVGFKKVGAENVSRVSNPQDTDEQ